MLEKGTLHFKKTTVTYVFLPSFFLRILNPKELLPREEINEKIEFN